MMYYGTHSHLEPTMPVTADKPAPYAPAATIIDVMSRHRDRGLPIPLNAETLGRIGVPDSLSSRVLYALTSLDLIDASGQPTATLENLRLAPEAEYKKRQEDWLKSAYADIFAFVDPSKDDETRIRDAFRSYQPVGQQSRMVTLFLGLCANAGMIAEKPAPVRQRASAPKPAMPAPRPSLAQVVRRAAASTKPVYQRHQGSLPPALAGLIESLPDASVGWTKADRDRFYATFGTVLDFCIPIRTAAQMGDSGAASGAPN
jgi:hypothetical protein